MKDASRLKDNGDAGLNKKFNLSAKIANCFKAALPRACNAVSDAVYPPDITCDICGDELVAKTRYNLCADCLEKLPCAEGHRCAVCGVPIDDEADYCLRCQNTESVFKLNRSPLVYDGEAKRLILSMKFGKKMYLSHTLGALMADEYLKDGINSEILVFVPMSEREYKNRGFNQAELLAYEVGARLNMPVLPALVKNKDTSNQKELDARDRAENLKGAFYCVFKEIKGRKLLLVDDVFTTGATANECAHTLLKAGAKEVSVLTAAVTKRKLKSE